MLELPQPQDDGLYIPQVGEWSSDKHYYLARYMDAFTTSMREKWRGLHYIDLFAGAGVERLKVSRTLEWGSPMLAAQMRFPFTRLHLCERSRTKFKVLKIRMDRTKPGSQVLHGDANEEVNAIIREIPEKTLSLAFLDPYGLHLEFATLKRLSEIRADLIVFFPDHLDALRNWEKHYLQDPNSNLDRWLGAGADWRSTLDATPHDSLAEVLRKLYVQQIASLGYTEFEYRRIMAKGHPLYVLIFCSRSAIAARLWRGISSKESDDQRMFPFHD
jgi:three-Cys-motif partner protein